MATKYDNQPQLDFSIFENRFATTSKHPSMTGVIEFTRPFLKAMVEEAKSGTMPTLKVAMWAREGRESGKPYQFMRLELKQSNGAAVEEPVDQEEEDDGLPF
jgi:hypothetical protein